MKVFKNSTGSHISGFRGASAAALGIALFVSTTAYAQEAPAPAADEGDEIIVTGFRASIENAIEARRSSDFIADFISSDDIAGLPDVSIAESLARLPGVSSQRTGGQASAINIRGLNQDLVSATLNGREQVSTSGNRTIEFDQYPSELISQAAVFKSPKASQIEGGVAGKVELRTARPLSNKDDFTATLNLRGSYNDRAKQNPDVSEYGYRASASIQGKLANDTLGFALGYSRLFQPNVATRFVQFDFTGNDQSGNPVPDLNGNGIPDRRSFGFEAIQFGGRETRDGVIGVLQFEPDPKFRVLIDGYYSRFKSDVRRRGYRVFDARNSGNIVANPIVVNNALTGATITNNSGNGVKTELVNQDESRRDELYTIGGNIAYDFSDKFTGAIDLSYSRGKSFFNNSGVNLRPFTQTATGPVRSDQIPGLIAVNYQTNALNLPNIRSISTNFTDVNIFRFDGLFIVPQTDIDELKAVSADFKYTVDGSFIKSFEFGGRYSQRDARRKITSFRTFGPDGGSLALLPSEAKLSGFNGDFAAAGLTNFIVADINALLDRGVGRNRVADQAQGFTRDQSFTISENVYSGYAQLNIDTIGGSLPFTGNIGLRIVRTEQGSVPQGTGGAGIFRGRSYTDFLPSANLSLQLADNDFLRLSVSRQISRPRFFELRGGIDARPNGSSLTGSGGNPALSPYRANQFDLAYEHYFGRSGVLTLGVFYKDLRSFIINGSINNFDFGAAGVRFQPPGPNDPPLQSLIGRFDAPINGNGGFVYGFEANFVKTFVELPAPFDGLGVSVNYSYDQSDLNFTSTRSGLPVALGLPGLSKHVLNPTIFYEKSGFSIRGSGRYRSSFVAPQVGTEEQIVTNASELVIDAQISYTFQEGSALNGLKLLVQGTNLTDEPTRSFFGIQAQTGTIQNFGRSVFVGASFKF